MLSCSKIQPSSRMMSETASANTASSAFLSSIVSFLNAFTILVSASLLFQIEPFIAKMILFWFGGVAAVWTVCLLFFQAVLLLGYLYVHLLMCILALRMQAWLHAVLLVGSLLMLLILLKDSL